MKTKARSCQFCTDLHATSLDGKTMRESEFLSQIKNIADKLAGVGNLVPHEEYVDAILEGLLKDYAPVVSIIESKFLPLLKLRHSLIRMNLELTSF
uniref:Retrovirus-related Pol polyprotein from transposon TNT 1-94 n=1 Tax=Cajanus cajan TaxID=3821 RepID=A0A151RLZ3_CAJCA|nr:hypothetical protein KK1_035007 [Cajanus cajan]